jgi:hypothetical protein
MSFLGGILTGSNPTLGGDVGNAGNIMGFGTATGEGDISAASGFDQSLLSGNQAQEAQLLAPQISNIQKQGQQQIQTAGEFGNRSGGTNASAQNNIDTQRSNVNNLVSQLTSGAASNLGSLGTSTLGQGIQANTLQAGESQMQLENEQNSLLGNSISGASGFGEAFGLGSGANALNPGVFQTMFG